MDGLGTWKIQGPWGGGAFLGTPLNPVVSRVLKPMFQLVGTDETIRVAQKNTAFAVKLGVESVPPY